MRLFDKFKKGLTKTREKLGSQLRDIFSSYTRISEALYDELEETLISADVGIDSTLTILDTLREKVRHQSANGADPAILQKLLTDTVAEVISPAAVENSLSLDHSPAVILIVGVNGSGKTTSIAKLAYHFQQQGKKVVLAEICVIKFNSNPRGIASVLKFIPSQ